jgi:hypothetical protein
MTGPIRHASAGICAAATAPPSTATVIVAASVILFMAAGIAERRLHATEPGGCQRLRFG